MTYLHGAFLILCFLLLRCSKPENQQAGTAENVPPATSRQVPDTDAARAVAIAEKYEAQLGSGTQVLVVFNAQPESPEAVLVALEKSKTGFAVKWGTIKAGIGRNGFAHPGEKAEGDGKSPTGCFRLGRLFTYAATVKTDWPFTQTTADDKWIDDPASPDYNRHVRGATDATSYEKLLLPTDTYQYCMVIEYNTQPVVKGKGSAIFFHLSEADPGPTLGCVAIPKADMLRVLAWLKPDQQPVILMGNAGFLLGEE